MQQALSEVLAWKPQVGDYLFSGFSRLSVLVFGEPSSPQ
jgi:hypothetical protein